MDLFFAARQMIQEESDVARKSFNIRNFIEMLQEAFNSIEKCKKPVIVCIQGGCLGAGVDLVCSCDIRLCSEQAYFSVKEVDIGLAADLGTLQRLPKIVGNDSWVREVCYTARKFDAEEALKIGFVSEILPSEEELRVRAFELALIIASKSPVAIAGTKFALNYSRDHTTQQGLLMQSIWNSAMLQTNDISVAMQKKNMAEKRFFSNL